MVREELAAVAAKQVELGRVFQRLRRRLDRVLRHKRRRRNRRTERPVEWVSYEWPVRVEEEPCCR